MSYFHTISLILGVALALGGFWFLADPVSYRNLAVKIMTEKRPGWFLLSALAMLGWIIYSWIRFSEEPSAAGAAICFVLSLTLIKAYYFTFRYSEFRAFAIKFINLEPSVLRVIGLIYLAASAALIALGLTV